MTWRERATCAGWAGVLLAALATFFTRMINERATTRRYRELSQGPRKELSQ